MYRVFLFSEAGRFFFSIFFFIDIFFSDSKFSGVEFLSLTLETHAQRFLLKDDKHPSKIIPYPLARSAHENSYSC